MVHRGPPPFMKPTHFQLRRGQLVSTCTGLPWIGIGAIAFTISIGVFIFSCRWRGGGAGNGISVNLSSLSEKRQKETP